MSTSPLLYAISSTLLRSFKPERSGAFSAWLHFERQWTGSDESAVASLITHGCRSILITGAEAEEIHDKIDYIAYDITKELVLTFLSLKANQGAASDILNTRCPESEPSFLLLSVFATDVRSETIALGKNLRLIGLEMDDNSERTIPN